MIDILIPSLKYSAFALVWVFALTDSGNIFDFIPVLVGKLTQNEKIHKLAYECEKCIAGQVALWACLISNRYSIYDYSWINVIWVITFSILFALIGSKIINRA